MLVWLLLAPLVGAALAQAPRDNGAPIRPFTIHVDESALGACLKRATKQIVFPRFAGTPFDVDIPISVGPGE